MWSTQQRQWLSERILVNITRIQTNQLAWRTFSRCRPLYNLVGSAVTQSSKQNPSILRSTAPMRTTWRSGIVSRAAGSLKVIYLLRTSPCFLAQEVVAEADTALVQSFGKHFALNLTGDAWRQATLPANFGGLSLPSVSSLILPCFFSSTNIAAALVDKVLNERIGTIDGTLEALAAWEQELEAPSRPQKEMVLQRTLLLTFRKAVQRSTTFRYWREISRPAHVSFRRRSWRFHAETAIISRENLARQRGIGMPIALAFRTAGRRAV